MESSNQEDKIGTCNGKRCQQFACITCEYDNCFTIRHKIKQPVMFASYTTHTATPYYICQPKFNNKNSQIMGANLYENWAVYVMNMIWIYSYVILIIPNI